MGFRRRGGGGGGAGASGGFNIQTVILGVVTIVIALIMLGIGMDIIDPMVGSCTTDPDWVNWTNYAGGQAMLQLFPLLMMISLVLFGGILIWIGWSGQSMTVRETILVTIVVVVAIILLPIVIDQTDTLLARSDIANYTGLDSFLGLVPLLYIIGALALTGILGFRQVRSKIPSRRKKKAY